eukprot:403375211
MRKNSFSYSQHQHQRSSLDQEKYNSYQADDNLKYEELNYHSRDSRHQTQSDDQLHQLQELREMLYQNVADLNAVKNSLIDCRRIPKSKRNQQISLIDQFLIDLNEELININYAIPNYEQSENLAIKI